MFRALHPFDRSDEVVEATRAYSRASGRRFANYVDELFWPDRELVLFLKNRSTAINITQEDISQITDRFRVLYDIDEDQLALPVALNRG